MHGLAELRGSQLPLPLAARNPLGRDGCAVSPMRGRRPPHNTAIALPLNLLRHPQHLAQTLALHHGALIHLAQLVVSGVGQRLARHPNLHLPIRILKHLYVLADQLPRLGTVG